MPTGTPVIPETITVHLGAPNTSAPNVTVPFADYIANVASSEIYPTWPESAIRANMLAQISFALNRVYTGFYRARGYDFDITNSTAYDQYYVHNREIFSNIRKLANELFTTYLRRPGNVEPLFAQYCNGTTVTCNGLSQWGSVRLAQNGLGPYDILTNYYGTNLELVRNAPVGTVTDTAPSPALRLGSANNQVRLLQIRLNRIRNNYPNIPRISQPNGIFTSETEDAVIAFQNTFNLTPDGIVGSGTWYAVERIYAAVKRLNSLNSEGLKYNEVNDAYVNVLQEGDANIGVALLQYYLDYIAAYYDNIPSLAVDGVFGPATRRAVEAAQAVFGLTVDGLVGEQTWNAIQNAYFGIIRTIPVQFREGLVVPYQGTLLREGSSSVEVTILQQYLNYISRYISEIPSVTPTGYFGTQTRAAVEAFQRLRGQRPDGIVNALVWSGIADLYSDLYIGNN